MRKQPKLNKSDATGFGLYQKPPKLQDKPKAKKKVK